MQQPTLEPQRPRQSDGMRSCPDCGEPGGDNLGPLPNVQFFAGRVLPRALAGGSLYRCRRCKLMYRWPRLDDYDSLYDNQETHAWGPAPLRHDQALVRAALATTPPGGRILDYGCYGGHFLASVEGRFDKYGVEVSTAAAQEARRQGFERVVSRLSELDDVEGFDAIVAMDVVEHVHSPRELLKQLVGHLKPDGVLLITTGDADSWLWRLAGARWWYCYYPEHISFISSPWFHHHADDLGIQVDSIHRFNYLQEGSSTRIRRVLHWMLYMLLPGRYWRRHRRRLAANPADAGVPGIGMSEDHVLVTIRRRRDSMYERDQ